MNAEETLSRLRKRYDVTLPSGMAVTIRLPRLRDCIIAGNVPLPVMTHLIETAASSNGDGPSVEDTAHMARFQDEVVRQTLVAIEGEDVTMTPEAVAELDQEDYDALAAYGTRATPIPDSGLPGVREIAAFASSEAGKAFARIEQHFGRDPAASLEEVDDVLAHNLRAALLFTLAEDSRNRSSIRERRPAAAASRSRQH